jgi:hypothetical protein
MALYHLCIKSTTHSDNDRPYYSGELKEEDVILKMQFKPHDPRVTFTINQCQFMSGICYKHKEGARTDFKKNLTAFFRVRKLTSIKVKNKNTKTSER